MSAAGNREPSDAEQFKRVCDDYARWYVEGRWTFERFVQAIEDAAAILFPPNRGGSS